MDSKTHDALYNNYQHSENIEQDSLTECKPCENLSTTWHDVILLLLKKLAEDLNRMLKEEAMSRNSEDLMTSITDTIFQHKTKFQRVSNFMSGICSDTSIQINCKNVYELENSYYIFWPSRVVAGAFKATKDEKQTFSSTLKHTHIQFLKRRFKKHIESYIPLYDYSRTACGHRSTSAFHHMLHRTGLKLCQKFFELHFIHWNLDFIKSVGFGIATFECSKLHWILYFHFHLLSGGFQYLNIRQFTTPSTLLIFEEISAEKQITENVARERFENFINTFHGRFSHLLCTLLLGNLRNDEKVSAVPSTTERRNSDAGTCKSTDSSPKVKNRGNMLTNAEPSKMTVETPTTMNRKTKRKVGKTMEKKSKRTERKGGEGSKLYLQMMWCESGVILRILQFFLYMGLLTRTVSASFSCAENQVAELGKQGTIVCSFPDNFQSVHWYDDAGDGRPPVVSYTRQTEAKSNFCLENESYDVYEDGSLLVCNVTAWHERNYTVVMYRDLDLFEEWTVSLTVVAYPVNRSVIVECDNWYDGGLCRSVQDSGALTCSFSGARPPVKIEWVERFLQGDPLATTQEFATTNNSNGTYNSSAKVYLVSSGGNQIAVLACVATYHSFSSEWRRENEILLDFSQSESFSNVPSTTHYMEINRRAEIQCGDSNHMFLIWKRILPIGEPETIGFRFYNLTRMTNTIAGLAINPEGNLVFSSPQIRHEGEYACVYKDGGHDKIQKTTVILLTAPSPPYIKIIGCDDTEYACALEEVMTQELTCTVDGVYPIATLQWISKDPSLISFYQPKNAVESIGQLYRVSSSVNYSVSDNLLCEDEIYVECRVQGPISRIVKAERIVKLTPERCTVKKGDSDGFWTSWRAIIQLQLPGLLLNDCLLLLLIFFFRNCQSKRKRGLLGKREELTHLNVEIGRGNGREESTTISSYDTEYL